ncbi:MAG: class I SAM-dependent methyltransferase, partial [Campylobacteraceae bacterium]|nr:class I SAM-dependent methyltransferase [Campylobacteraceae bacterium]
IIGYDIDSLSLKIATLLSYAYNNVKYKKQDFNTIDITFDVITATSLLSVVPNKTKTLTKLISLLKDSNSTLILIEPTKALFKKNVWKKIDSFKSFWFYKGLLLWAKARENKAIDNDIFENLENISIKQTYFLDEMVCITYIQKADLVSTI